MCVCLCVRTRGEALQVLMGRLWMAVREKRRVDEALPQTHRRQAFQVQSLRQVRLKTPMWHLHMSSSNTLHIIYYFIPVFSLFHSCIIMHAISLILSKMHTVRQFNTNQNLKYTVSQYMLMQIITLKYYFVILIIKTNQPHLILSKPHLVPAPCRDFGNSWSAFFVTWYIF